MIKTYSEDASENLAASVVTDRTQGTVYSGGVISSILPSCMAYNAGLSVSSSTFTKPALDTDQWDPYDMHSTVTNTSRITVPSNFTTPQIWLAGAYCSYPSNTSGIRLVAVFLHNSSGTELQYYERHDGYGAAGGSVYTAKGMFYDVQPGDYFTARLYQTSGSSLSVNVYVWAVRFM